MPPDAHRDRVLILDFGSQFTQLIARRIRERGVYCEIHPCHVALETVRDFAPKGVVLSGGPSSVLDADAPFAHRELLELGVPVLGVCYGLQWMCQQLGGVVEASDDREYGRAQLKLERRGDPLFAGLEDRPERTVWMSHGDRVAPPAGRLRADRVERQLAVCRGAPPDEAALRHPVPSRGGAHRRRRRTARQLRARHLRLRRFVVDGDVHRRGRAQDPRHRSADAQVVCGLSGGVDSSVAAALVHRAIGDKLHCILVDHGLLRENEAAEVERIFREGLGIPLAVVDARKRFLDALAGVTDPEKKRRIIGHLFIETFEREAERIGDASFLVQGTLYPDVIESVSVRGPSQTIKTHHNVGGLPERMKLALVEPLRELFKDEVREVGRKLGISETLIGGIPFPGRVSRSASWARSRPRSSRSCAVSTRSGSRSCAAAASTTPSGRRSRCSCRCRPWA